jgi:DNA mismatch repair protein MutS
MFKVATLDGFGLFTDADIAAANAVVDYIALTQKGSLPRLEAPRPILSHHLLALDAATHRNLELMVTLAGERKGSLLATLDRTLTSAGARRLSRAMTAPLASASAINKRLEGVAYFHHSDHLRKAIREVLKGTPDLERSLSRLSLARGGPRDLAAIREGLKSAQQVKASLERHPAEPPHLIQDFIQNLGSHNPLINHLQRALHDSLPILARDGGFIAPGYAPSLDALISLRDEGKKHIIALQTRYCAETGISSLKIRHNNIIGYHVDVTATHAGKLPSHFIHRQTLANSQRYTTVELAELEQKIIAASSQSLELEQQLYNELTHAVLTEANAISSAARGLASIDMLAALADLAVEQNYCRPQVDESREFIIHEGRHPVVEATLHDQATAFISNDCALNEQQRIWLLTGPNMAGKSTFLRQNALISLMAHMGSFVPAASAHIGVIDRIFSRVGAADDLARGRSTFMVEMVETAAILNQATPRSLVILDEVGRGTSTYDGMSIAWAAIEHLHNHNQCRALFATHYHELTVLEKDLPHLRCYTMKIQEWEGSIVFLHKIIAGTADRSYGLHVAALAGLPPIVLARAEEILNRLESNKSSSLPSQQLETDSSLISNDKKTAASSPFAAKLARIAVDDLTPRQALDLLYELKTLLSFE